MKAKGLVWVIILCLFLSSCFSSFFEDTDEKITGVLDPTTPLPIQSQTRVDLRNNLNETNSHAVNVYLTVDRAKLFATVPARRNLVLAIEPNMMQHFYFTYLLKFTTRNRDIEISYIPTKYGSGVNLTPIPDQTTTHTPVYIPSLYDVIKESSSPGDLALPLVNDIYFSIYNDSATQLYFNLNGSPINPVLEQSPSLILQPQTSHIYIVSQSFQFSVNTDNTFIDTVLGGVKYPLSSLGRTFQAGHLYEIDYRSGSIAFVKETPIDILNTGLEVKRVNVTLSPNGGSGSSVVISEQVSGLEISLQSYNKLFTPPSGFTFGGWNTNQQGTGANYTDKFIVPENNTTLYAKWLAPLGVPSNVYGTPSSTSIVLTWTGVSAATGYAVYIYSDPEDPQSLINRQSITGNVTSCTVSGLQSETTYFFRVAATNANGEGRLSDASPPVRTTTSAGTVLNVVDSVTVDGDSYTGNISSGSIQYVSVDLTPGTYRFTCVDSDSTSSPGYADISTGLANKDGSIVIAIEDRWASNPVNVFDYTVTVSGTYLFAIRATDGGMYQVKVATK